MKCSLAISNFLEEVSSLSHSIVFLCFFAVIIEMTGLELIVEKSYEAYSSSNIHFKITGLVIRFLRRRNCPHTGYIVVI